MSAANAPRVGHGDHWLAALDERDPRLAQALGAPLDAPDALTLHRSALTEALDMVQVTAARRLVTAYPEPRATTLVALKPRELHLWETGVEGWLVGEHETVGVLTVFLTDLAAAPERYQKAKGPIALEVGALAYLVHPWRSDGPARLTPAARHDVRFLPDDYRFEGDVRATHPAGEADVLDIEVHGWLVLPVVARGADGIREGDRVQGFAWLTGRLPDA